MAIFDSALVRFNLLARWNNVIIVCCKYSRTRAREIVGFAGSGPIFETENRFISRQGASKSVHKTLYF